MRNRRVWDLVDVERPARIATPDGAVSRDCTLRNISARGAKLVLADHEGLPESVVLHMDADAVRWPCRIVRRRPDEIGVLFS